MKVGKYTIKWRYHRYDPTPKLDKNVAFTEQINYTACIIDDGEESEVCTAICHPSDNFDKDTGRRLSLARCMKDLGIPKKDRKMIWEAYRDMTPKKRW